MHITVFILLSSVLADLTLGTLVYLTNSRRTVNQYFLNLSVQMAFWAACVLRIVESTTSSQAEFWIRAAFFVTAFFPGSFTLLELAIKNFDENFTRVLKRAIPFLLLNLSVAVVCLTDFFLTGVQMPGAGAASTVPEAVYGPGFRLFVIYFLLACAAAAVRFFKDLSQSEGLRRAELQFVLLGFTVAFILGTTLALFIPLFLASQQASQFAPLAVISLNIVIAYGIATRRIMDVANVLRRLTAYMLATAYLVILYSAVWWASDYLFTRLLNISFPIPHLIAALAVAFSLAPTNGIMQRFANQLFINLQAMNISVTMQKASRILQSINPLDELLQQFTETIREAVGTDRITILLATKRQYEQRYPLVRPEDRLVIPLKDPLLIMLGGQREPVVADAIRRLRPSRQLEEVSQRMTELQAAVAVGIHSKRGLEGIMLLGPRLSGRVYGSVEQDSLQLLCDQLAVAVENAKLYTQLQDGKIYNDILLDNLVSGVVAANADGIITVFNREAQRITRLKPSEVLNQPINVLPPALAQTLEDTFESESGIRDKTIHIRHEPNEDIHLRVGSSIFHTHSGQILGALLVFNDFTTIKKLELQVRRTDRLASIGTLSAGMAHEIKNPLVTIKTFAQLLPERYDDPDFRETFSTLLGREVKRIDSIVNNLLRFARPAKPALFPTHLHDVLKNSLLLVQQQFEQKNIRLTCAFKSENDMINADANQLEQAFINFFFNAIQSMEGNGNLHVSTELVTDSELSPESWEGESGTRIWVSIKDTGIGIQPENIPHIFDPFFTTKSEGTGLGLSVAHRIVQEHHGVIDVESEINKGTTFNVSFPLIAEEARV